MRRSDALAGRSSSSLRHGIQIVVVLLGSVRRKGSRFACDTRKAVEQGDPTGGRYKAYLDLGPLRQSVRGIKDNHAVLDMSANSHHPIVGGTSLSRERDPANL